MKVWDLIRLQETVGVFCMGDIFSAIWFLCRADSESIFILLVLSSVFINPLVSWLPAPSPLCSLLEAARVTLVVGRGKSQYCLSLHALSPSSPLSCSYRAGPHEGSNLYTLFIQCHRQEPQQPSTPCPACWPRIVLALGWAQCSRDVNKEEALLAILDKREGCTCRCRSGSLQSYELKPS